MCCSVMARVWLRGELGGAAKFRRPNARLLALQGVGKGEWRKCLTETLGSLEAEML
jgi:hypothetical protein